MSQFWSKEKLSIIAPSSPLKVANIKPDDSVWQLNLDCIEAGTGKLLDKKILPYSSAGSSTHWFSSDHVLYSKLRPYLNKVLLPNEVGLGTTELVPLLPNKSRLHREYLAYYLRSNQFVNWISEQTAGAKMPRVSMKVFWEHQIPLPPLAEQQKIAAILDAADNLRQKDQQLVDHYTTLSQSLFLEMFGDPVANPMGWEMKEASKYYQVRGRVGWKGYKKTDLRQEGAIVLGATHINKAGNIDLSKAVYLSDEKYLESPEIKVHRFDLIFVQRGNTIGKVALVRDDLGEATINPVVLIFRPVDANPYFLLYLLMNKRLNNQFVGSNSGSAQPMITQKTMKEFLMINVPINLQNRFAEKVKSIEAQKQQARASLEKTNDLFNSLLQRAFNGELTGNKAA